MTRTVAVASLLLFTTASAHADWRFDHGDGPAGEYVGIFQQDRSGKYVLAFVCEGENYDLAAVIGTPYTRADLPADPITLYFSIDGNPSLSLQGQAMEHDDPGMIMVKEADAPGLWEVLAAVEAGTENLVMRYSDTRAGFAMDGVTEAYEEMLLECVL